MEIKTLEKTDTKDIVNTFNQSFSDYFIPFELNQEQLTSKMIADKTDLELSVGVFEQGDLVAFILHGFDVRNSQKLIYNGGTGVIPEKRGFGLTKQMYQFILPILTKKGINKLLLEVIAQNTPAIKSYQQVGFKTIREVICYKGKAEITQTNQELVIQELKSYNWDLMESFWEITPTWQNSNNVLDILQSNNISLGVYTNEQLVAYVIYNPNSKRIQQLAVHQDFRRQKLASTLVSKLVEKYGNRLSIINVDGISKGINTFLTKIGLEPSLKQLEMELALDKNIYETKII